MLRQQGRHQVHTWSGTAYEIGFRHGRELRNEIVTEYEPALSQCLRDTGWTEAKLLDCVVRRNEPFFAHFAPRAIEEIHGIAAGSELSYSHAFFAATRDGMTVRPGAAVIEEACTSFLCGRDSTEDDKILLGQTKDTAAPLERYHIVRLAYNDGLRATMLNYPGWIGNLSLSSHGVAHAGNSLAGQPATGDTAPFSLLKRLALERESVREILNAIDGLNFENGCFLIADRSGHGVCLESVAGRMEVHEIAGGAFGHANGALAPALQPYIAGHDLWPSSAERQRNIDRLLRENHGSLSVNTLKTVIADHSNSPHSICYHGTPRDPNQTTAAFVADLDAGAMHIAIGSPCAAPFVSYLLPD